MTERRKKTKEKVVEINEEEPANKRKKTNEPEGEDKKEDGKTEKKNGN